MHRVLLHFNHITTQSTKLQKTRIVVCCSILHRTYTSVVTTGPLAAYRAAIAKGELKPDEAQFRTVWKVEY